MRSPRLFHLATFLLVSAVSAQTKVVFVSVNLNRQADKDILAYLEGRYGKSNVTFHATEPLGNLNASDILGYDVAVLSAPPLSSRYRNIKLNESPTPIVNMEEAVADNGVNEFSITMGRTKESEIGHAITIKTAHPITMGFTVNQKVTITNGKQPSPGEEVWWSTGSQASGSTSLACDDDTATNLFLTIVDQGATLLNNTKAPCRRVMFGLTDNTFEYFTADGKKLFGQAVDWAAAGCCARTSNYGKGLAGANGVPTLTTSANPVFKSSINVLGSNSSGASANALLLVGTQQIAVPYLGGTLLVDPAVIAGVTVPAAGLILPVTVPDLSGQCGNPKLLSFQVQLLQLDSKAVAGVSMTPGMQIRTGR